MKEHKFSIKNRFKSFKYAINGIKLLVKTEHNSRVHMVAAIVAVILGFVLGITTYEWLALTFAIALVLITELLNTAIEKLADIVDPKYNKLIGNVKDYAAGAVLIAAIAALIMGCIIFIPKIFTFLI